MAVFSFQRFGKRNFFASVGEVTRKRVHVPWRRRCYSSDDNVDLRCTINNMKIQN